MNRGCTSLVLAVLIPTVVCRAAVADMLTDGGFESVDRYPTLYGHVNAEIKKAIDARWDFGDKGSFPFTFQWYPSPSTPGGWLRVSADARSGKNSLELGNGGEVYCLSYKTPLGEASRFPVGRDCSYILRLWAKGSGKVVAHVREFDKSGALVREVAVGSPRSLPSDWTEFAFIYRPQEEKANDAQLALAVEGRGKVDDVSLNEVVEYGRLIRQLKADLAMAQGFAQEKLLQGREKDLQNTAGSVGGILEDAAKPELTVEEELAMRDKIAPIAETLRDIVWQGRGKRAGKIVLSSQRLRVEFYGKDLNYRLASIGDPESRVNFLGKFSSEVWRIVLANPKWKSSSDPAAQPPVQSLLTSDSKCASLSHSLDRGGRALALNWRGVAIPGSQSTLAVRVTVTLAPNSRFSRWRINVSGARDCAINEVRFPVLASLQPMTPEGKEDYLAVPYGPGRLMKNPYDLRSLSLRYPSGMTLQCWALYSAKAGLYFATEDGEGYLKGFSFSTTENERSLNAQLANLPENNMSAGNRFPMPYDAVVGTFDGDWWVASKIYRGWAVQRKWCKTFGPIHATREIPQWYKELPLWVLLYEPPNCVEKDILDGKVTGDFAAQFPQCYGGLPVALHYYGWENGHKSYAQGEYSPPGAGDKGFPMLLKQMRQHSVRVVPYVQGYLFNTTFDWYRKEGGDKGAVYFSGGAPIIYDAKAGGGYQFMTWMCPYARVWQDMHAKVAAMLARYGADGVYFDSLAGNVWPCYNPAHGHPPGGGSYCTAGARQLVASARAAAKAINPNMIFVSESPTEIHVGNLDGCLQFCYSQFPDSIPFFSSVYHDYFLLWGNNYTCDYPGQDQKLWREFDAWNYIPVAQSFVRGDQLGWFAQGWLVAKEFTTYLAKIRMGPASKFLTYGEMMEPPRLLNQLPTVKTPPWYSSNGEKDPRTFPAVLTSAWKAPDGSIGLVFCNISNEEQKVSYRIEVTRYGLPKTGKYVMKTLESDGSVRVLGMSNSAAIERVDTIGVRKVMVIEVQPQVKA